MRKQILPWFGSKAALAPQILTEFGPHRMYVEPFAGAMAMLLSKDPVRHETVNDLHLDLTNLARCLQDGPSAAALLRRVSRTVCSEQLNREARQRLDEPFQPTLDRAVDWFVVGWMSKSGMLGSTGSQTMAHSYTASANTCARRLRQAAESIRAWHARLKHVTVLNRCAFKLLAKLRDSDGLLIYCDPPYIEKGGKYRHDLEAEEHQRLATALSRFQRARVIVSYTDHPRLAELYRGWTVRVLKYESRANRTAKVPKAKPAEVLLINGPSLVIEPTATTVPRPRSRRSIDLAA